MQNKLLITLKVSLFTSILTLILMVLTWHSNLELGIIFVLGILTLVGLIFNIILTIIFVKESILGKLLYAIISAGFWIILLNGLGFILKILKIIP